MSSLSPSHVNNVKHHSHDIIILHPTLGMEDSMLSQPYELEEEVQGEGERTERSMRADEGDQSGKQDDGNDKSDVIPTSSQVNMNMSQSNNGMDVCTQEERQFQGSSSAIDMSIEQQGDGEVQGSEGGDEDEDEDTPAYPSKKTGASTDNSHTSTLITSAPLQPETTSTVPSNSTSAPVQGLPQQHSHHPSFSAISPSYSSIGLPVQEGKFIYTNEQINPSIFTSPDLPSISESPVLGHIESPNLTFAPASSFSIPSVLTTTTSTSTASQNIPKASIYNNKAFSLDTVHEEHFSLAKSGSGIVENINNNTTNNTVSKTYATNKRNKKQRSKSTTGSDSSTSNNNRHLPSNIVPASKSTSRQGSVDSNSGDTSSGSGVSTLRQASRSVSDRSQTHSGSDSHMQRPIAESDHHTSSLKAKNRSSGNGCSPAAPPARPALLPNTTVLPTTTSSGSFAATTNVIASALLPVPSIHPARAASALSYRSGSSSSSTSSSASHHDSNQSPKKLDSLMSASNSLRSAVQNAKVHKSSNGGQAKNDSQQEQEQIVGKRQEQRQRDVPSVPCNGPAESTPKKKEKKRKSKKHANDLGSPDIPVPTTRSGTVSHFPSLNVLDSAPPSPFAPTPITHDAEIERCMNELTQNVSSFAGSDVCMTSSASPGLGGVSATYGPAAAQANSLSALASSQQAFADGEDDGEHSTRFADGKLSKNKRTLTEIAEEETQLSQAHENDYARYLANIHQPLGTFETSPNTRALLMMHVGYAENEENTADDPAHPSTSQSSMMEDSQICQKWDKSQNQSNCNKSPAARKLDYSSKLIKSISGRSLFRSVSPPVDNISISANPSQKVSSKHDIPQSDELVKVKTKKSKAVLRSNADIEDSQDNVQTQEREQIADPDRTLFDRSNRQEDSMRGRQTTREIKSYKRRRITASDEEDEEVVVGRHRNVEYEGQDDDEDSISDDEPIEEPDPTDTEDEGESLDLDHDQQPDVYKRKSSSYEAKTANGASPQPQKGKKRKRISPHKSSKTSIPKYGFGKLLKETKAVVPKHDRQSKKQKAAVPQPKVKQTVPKQREASNVSKHDNEEAKAVRGGRTTRRSARSSSSSWNYKYGDKFAFETIKPFLSGAKARLIGDGHAIGLSLGSMAIDEDQELIETQRLDPAQAYQRTWQIFIYCQNRGRIQVRGAAVKTESVTEEEQQSEPDTDEAHAPGNRLLQNAEIIESSQENEAREDDDEMDLDRPAHSMASPGKRSYRDRSATPPGIWRHTKNAACPAQISAHLVIHPRNITKSHWVVDEVSDHCLECIDMDCNIGKGTEDPAAVKAEFLSYWDTVYEARLENALSMTHDFHHFPTGPVQPEEARNSDPQVSDLPDGILEDVNQDDMHQDDDADGQDHSHADFADIVGGGGDHLNDYPDLFYDEQDDSDSSLEQIEKDALKQQAAKNVSSATSALPAESKAVKVTRHNRANATSRAAKSATPVGDELPLKVRKPKNRKKASTPSLAVRLEPATRISDLGIHPSIRSLLDQWQIKTLGDLRVCLLPEKHKGGPSDAPVLVEDYLAYIHKHLGVRPRGQERAQVLQPGPSRAGRVTRQEELEDDEDEDEDADEQGIWLRRQPEYARPYFRIYPAAQILNSALRALVD